MLVKVVQKADFVAALAYVNSVGGSRRPPTTTRTSTSAGTRSHSIDDSFGGRVDGQGSGPRRSDRHRLVEKRVAQPGDDVGADADSFAVLDNRAELVGERLEQAGDVRRLGGEDLVGPVDDVAARRIRSMSFWRSAAIAWPLERVVVDDRLLRDAEDARRTATRTPVRSFRRCSGRSPDGVPAGDDRQDLRDCGPTSLVIVRYEEASSPGVYVNWSGSGTSSSSGKWWKPTGRRRPGTPTLDLVARPQIDDRRARRAAASRPGRCRSGGRGRRLGRACASGSCGRRSSRSRRGPGS